MCSELTKFTSVIYITHLYVLQEKEIYVYHLYVCKKQTKFMSLFVCVQNLCLSYVCMQRKDKICLSCLCKEKDLHLSSVCVWRIEKNIVLFFVCRWLSSRNSCKLWVKIKIGLWQSFQKWPKRDTLLIESAPRYMETFSVEISETFKWYVESSQHFMFERFQNSL